MWSSRRFAGVLAAVLAMLVLPGWGSGAPPLDWRALPSTPVQVTADVSVVRCSEAEPILCVSQAGHEDVGGIEHLVLPMETLPRLAAALDAGATVREALELEVAAFHDDLSQDRAVGCPDGYAFRADPTRPALVAGEAGVRSSFTVVDADDRVVERGMTWFAVSDDALQVFGVSALADGACIPDEGYPFTPAALDAAEPVLAQLIARAEVPRGPHRRGPLTVPVGGDGVTYDEPDGEGEQPVGPSAVAVDADGTTWILDVEAQRLVRVAADGTLLAPADLSAGGTDILFDVDVRGDGLVVLGVDRPSGQPRLILVDGDGVVTDVHALPASTGLEVGLSGLAVVDDGVVLAELEGGARLVQVLDAAGQPTDTPVDAYRWHAHTYRLQYGDVPGVVIDGRLIEVRTDHEFAGMHVLGAAPDGSAWVAVDELRGDTPVIDVDRTVRRYAPDGRLLGSARVDLDDRYTVVENHLAVGPDGTVWVLQTRPAHAEIVPLRLRDHLPAVFPPAHPVERLAAEDAVGTALALSGQAYPAGSASQVLLARDDVFADSLASGGVQGMTDAPLLLTGRDALDDRVVAELHRLGAARVTVLGGEAAVSPDVVTALESNGFAVDRVAGDTRIGTAVALARTYAPQARRVVLVRADGPEATQAYADALAAGALAAWGQDPVLLTPSDALAPQVRDHLVETHVVEIVVAGGEAAVSAAVIEELQGLGIAVDRAGGADRAATAVALAARRGVPSGLYADAVLLVDGRTWVDGLVAPALSARTGAPVLLTDGDGVPPATAAYLAAAERPPALVCTPSVTAAACEAAAG